MARPVVHLLAEFLINAEHAEDHWVTVTHIPCGRFIFGNQNDPASLDAATLLALIEAHRCPTGEHAIPDLGGYARPVTFDSDGTPHWPTNPGAPDA